jgi:hypothetical protein
VHFSKPLDQSHARVVPNHGAGDCLFLSFQQAMAWLGRHMSVEELRAAVANSLTGAQLQELMKIYADARESGDAELLVDYGFMRGVASLPELRARVMSREYWGDETALPALESATGLRARVVLQRPGEMAVLARRLDNDERGGERGGERGAADAWAPRPFIVLLLRGQHYSLIEVDGQRVFWEDGSMLSPQQMREALEAKKQALVTF